MIDFTGVEYAALVLAATLLLAVIVCSGAIVLAWPWLKTYALARPNARSSHNDPTPQGGGVAVVAATLMAAWTMVALCPAVRLQGGFLPVTIATLLLAWAGAVDDFRSLPATLRLALQGIAVGAVIAAIPQDAQFLPFLPWWVERLILALGGVWFVNLVNFMDGIDWMTVAETLPLTGAVALFGLYGALDPLPAVVAAALFGAMLGFAPFNRPVARLFLGDVGSLPIGLLLGWLLIALAIGGHLAAALILPLYYLTDATLTLLLRMVRGEPFWQAHRTHFYQRAIDRGFTVSEIVARVLVANVELAALAFVTIAWPNEIVGWVSLAVAGAVVGWLLVTFEQGKSRSLA